MRNRFRRLPSRIEPLYETVDVTPPRPLPDVRETNWLTAVRGHVPARRPTRHRLIVGLIALFALVVVVASVVGLTR